MSFLIALTLALDQRIEWQLPALLALAIFTASRCPPIPGRNAKELGWLLVVVAYLVLNSLVTFTDSRDIADNWWAAPARIFVYYVLLMALARVIYDNGFGSETVYRTLEWLLSLKVALVALEAITLLSTGAPSERPLFNMVLDTDTLFGVRFTSSYDFLFALFALSPRLRTWRLTLLTVAILMSETRALLLLSGAMFAIQVVRSQRATSIAAALAALSLAVLAALFVLTQAPDSNRDTPVRLLQFSGSSVDDKVEQVAAILDRFPSPYMVTGRGLGTSLAGILRDELRPYSYEAQTIVMLWQGGLLFFLVHAGVVLSSLRPARLSGLAIVLALGCLNPTLFGLASAFFLIAFSLTLHDSQFETAAADGGAAVHPQRRATS